MHPSVDCKSHQAAQQVSVLLRRTGISEAEAYKLLYKAARDASRETCNHMVKRLKPTPTTDQKKGEVVVLYAFRNDAFF